MLLKKFIQVLPKNKNIEEKAIIIDLKYNMIKEIEEIYELVKELNNKGYYLIMVEDGFYMSSETMLEELFEHKIKIIEDYEEFDSSCDLESYFMKNTLEFNYTNKNYNKTEKTSLIKKHSKKNQKEKEFEDSDFVDLRELSLKTKIKDF